MIYILTILGGLLSVVAMGDEAILFGLLCGYLLGAVIRQNRRLARMEGELKRLQRVPGRQARETAPETDSPVVMRQPDSATVAAQSLGAGEADAVSAWAEETRGQTRWPGAGKSWQLPTAGLLTGLQERIKAYFMGGNLMVRVGVIVLFFGVAFLLKYASEHSQLPMELRLAAVALGGIVMLLLGWRLRHKRTAYALALQGGAVGVLYLTVFAALRLYSLLPPTLAFALLLLFVGLSALLALLQDAKILAVLATAGGFLAPVLTSTGEGSHVSLFAYYLLLNGGVLAIAWFRAWRVLNLVGFVFTFVIASLWGMRYYRPDFFATTEPFLVLFFLMYVGIAVLFALRQPPQLKGIVDGTLVFGVPLVCAALQAALVQDTAYGLAISALAMGALYILLAGWLFRRGGDALRMLSESFLATGVVFATLAIPFALEGRLTSAFWGLEGAAMIWIGIRQARLLPRLFGGALQLLAGLLYLDDFSRAGWDWPLLNSHYLGALLIACAGLFSAYYLDRHRDKVHRLERALVPLFFAWGVVWWLAGAMQEIEHFVPSANAWAWLLAVLAGSAILAEYLKGRLGWERLQLVVLGLLPAMLLVALGLALDQSHPLVEWVALGWLVALATHYLLLRRYDEARTEGFPLWHAAAFWLLSYLLTAETAWQLDRAVAGALTWELIAWGLVPVTLLLLLLTVGQRLSWPVARFYRVYITLAVAPVAIYLLAWAMWVNATSAGAAWPLRYLPVLNPLDLTLLLVLFAWVKWWQRAQEWLQEQGASRTRYFALLGAGGFLWLNGVMVRSVHHWAGVGFAAAPMYHSQILQAAVAVLWSIIGLGCMLIGTRLGKRIVWLVGAALMGLVVAKLFLVDLSNTGTVARIVSFMGVGLILLVVGYFSPAPPRTPLVEDEGIKEESGL